MKFKWLAWVLIAVQVIIMLLGSYTRLKGLVLYQFAGLAEIIGFLVGYTLYLASSACVILLAVAYVMESD